MHPWTPQRWQQAQEILDLIEELPDEDPKTILEQYHCDLELRCYVEAAVAQRDTIDTFLEQPLGGYGQGLPPPARIGPYRLIRELGKGGMGVVYLAQQEEPFERRVALKLIHPLVYNDDTVRRFEAERQILAHFEHPNVVQLYDGGTTDDGQPYFVMEYVDGKSLESWCDREPSLHRRLNLFLQVCSAVELAHQKLRIVHRDLKPGNILVTADEVPKLLDFGIAKNLDDIALPRALHGSAWTPLFTSPEQLAGEPLATTSDIYSLGVLLYRMLSGRLPYTFKGADAESVRREILERTLPPLAIDDDLDAIVARALAHDPDQRYPSVEQLAADLRRFLAHRPVLAHPDSTFYRVRKFLRRHRLQAIAASITLLLGTGLVVGQVRRVLQVSQVSSSLVDLLRALQPTTPDQRAHLAAALDRATQLVNASMFAQQPLDQALLLDNLGRAYLSLERYKVAEGLLRQALDLRRRLLGEDHILVAESLQNLASLERKVGRHEEARAHLGQTLRISAQHGETRELEGAINNLAVLLHDRGELDAAAALARRVVELRQQHRPPDHPELVTARSNLASVLLSQGEAHLAEALYRQNLEIRLRLLGADHKDVATTRNQLAIALYDQGALIEAEALARQALDVRRALLGPRNPLIGSVLNSLGRILHARGRWPEAEEVFREALDHIGGTSDTERLHAAVVRRNLAALLTDGGSFEEAEDLGRHALEEMLELRSEGDWRVEDTRSVLGSALAGQGRIDEALALLLPSYRRLRTSRGPKAPVTCEAALRLIDTEAMSASY